MSRFSDKINIIDQSTYHILKEDNGKRKVLRSSKYKNKHKEEPKLSLLDFLTVPRQKQKQQKRPHLIIARKSVSLQTKHKGKTRLHPKRRIARLKRIIRNYRSLRQHNVDNETKYTEEIQKSSETEEPHKLTLCVTANENDRREQNLALNYVVPNPLQVIEDLKCLTLNEEKSEKATLSTPKHKIHSRRFRSYCDNCTTPRLKELTTQLLNDLDRFQKRAYAHNEIKARAHPRLVVGFRESLSRLRINKVKLLILAPDCENCPLPGGLDDTIDELKSVCQQQKVPYCFSLMRRELAYALHKRAQISCVAILDFDGANETFKQLLKELDVASYQYKCLTAT
ncbi:selenocysteine insertion sequence-binding protein 2 [Drosophila hydei]|uniref:Selenocysteine insertion sequence-binding protein 2 n=1 Tax=Drosophila hydei TaxID=7224 RepID=A0A6J1M2I9_DROHY|nr:selenocysteine insertion sequence-binding protein 2 [Drosophila hydei]